MYRLRVVFQSTLVVPPVDTTSLQYALERLDKAGLRVQLTDFGPLPPGYVLEGAGIGDQDPEAGHRVRRGTVVRHDPDDVLDAYVVTAESPPAETRLPYGGTKTADGGVRPTTITVRIGVRD